jgi:signal transduction histidine kinase
VPGAPSNIWERSFLAQAAMQAHLESSVGIADFFSRVTETVAELVGARRVVFSLLDEAERRLLPQADAYGFTAEELALIAPPAVNPRGKDPASRVVYANAVVHARAGIDDPQLAPFAGLARALHVTDAVAVCWRAANHSLGTVTAFDSRRGGFTDDDVRVLRTAAQTAGAVWRHTLAEAKLERLYEEAREANRAMDGFVSTLVHELRGPLTVINGYAAMIAAGELGEPPENWRRALGFLVEHAGRMRRLVDDLLYAARLSGGGEPHSLQRLDLRGAVVEALGRADAAAGLARAHLVRTLPEHPVMVDADPGHIALILDNLLANALAYGGSPPAIEVTLEADGDARVAVTDHGRGVPEGMRERIFERFVRVEGPGTPPGTGLGLYISRELATRNGGTLSLDESRLGMGSTFSMRLPRAGEGDGEPPPPPLTNPLQGATQVSPGSTRRTS